MFNEEQKLAFIKSTTKSASSAKSLGMTFRHSEEQEAILNADICTWNEDQIVSFFKSRKHTNIRSLQNECYAIRKYVKWCAENQIPNTSGAINDVDVSSLVNPSGYTEKMIDSPASLTRYLSNISEGGKANTPVFIFNAYYWFAFCGIPQDLLFSVKKNNIDVQKHTISIDGLNRNICVEAEQAIEYITDLAKASETIFSGYEHVINSRDIGSYIKGRIADAKYLTYDNVYKSGLFYRMYQRELSGFPVSFDEEVMRGIERREYAGHGNDYTKRGSIRSRKSKMRKTLLNAYALWKIAFNLE